MHEIPEYVPRYYKPTVRSRHRIATIKQRDMFLIDVIDNGLSLEASAMKNGISGPTGRFQWYAHGINKTNIPVVNFANRHGSKAELYESCTSGVKVSDHALTTMKAMYIAGMTQVEVAQRLGLARNTVQKYCSAKNLYRTDLADPTEDYGLPHA